MALLASLLVAAPGPIKAQDPEPDYLATFEACPEDVIPDADFSDVSSRHENAQDIDCIAYYGITKGTSPTTYSPDRSGYPRAHGAVSRPIGRARGYQSPPRR